MTPISLFLDIQDFDFRTPWNSFAGPPQQIRDLLSPCKVVDLPLARGIINISCPLDMMPIQDFDFRTPWNSIAGPPQQIRDLLSLCKVVDPPLTRGGINISSPYDMMTIQEFR